MAYPGSGGFGSSSLDGMSDTNLTGAVNNQHLMYNSAGSTWMPVTPFAGTLAALSDTDTSAIAAGKVLTMGLSHWEALDAAGGGGGAAGEISAQVRKDTGLAVTNNSYDVVTAFNAAKVDYDNGTMWSALATDRLTIPAGAGGNYVGMVWTSFAAWTGHLTCRFQVNGTTAGVYNHPIRQYNATSWNAGFVSQPLFLDATDYVRIIFHQNSGGTVTTNDETLFSLFKIGAGGANTNITLDYSGTNVSNSRFLDTLETSEDLADTMRTGTCVPFACKLAYSAIKIDSFGGDETIEILEGASVKATITVTADDLATDHTGSSITFAAGSNLRVKAATNFGSSEDIHVKLVLEKV